MIDLKDIFYEFSSRNALELIRKISAFHRAKGSLEYSKARGIIQNYLKNSTLLTFPMDKTYNTWQSPPSWNLNGGYLKYQNGKYIVSDLSLTPISAIFLSDKTDGVEKLEVFDVGKGETEEDYKNFEPGNAVLADGNPTLVYHYAIEKFNARCVLSYHMKAQDKSIERTPELLPDTINYTSFPSFKDKYAFGYALSYDQFQELREKLKKGKVYIEAFLDADQGTNILEVLQENIGKDTDQPAIILTAHLCHPKPGANDNASGSALLAEIMRVLEKFQDQLNRKIIGLWIAEMYGTAAYLTTEFPKNAYVINLDMVGEDQFKTGSTLKLTPSPWAIPSFLAELLYVNLEYPAFRLSFERYSGGSDHYMFSDPNLEIPAVSLTNWPDRYYHSSDDTVDKCSKNTLDWIGKAVLKTIYDLDNMSQEVLAQVKGKIISNHFKLVNVQSKLITNCVNYMTYLKLQQLSKYGDVEEELIEFFKEKIDFNLIPSQKRKIRKNIGPISDSWYNIEDIKWMNQIREKIPNFRDFLDVFLNVFELGFSKEEAIIIAKAELGIEEDLKAEVEHYLQRLKEEKLIESGV